MKQTNLDFDWAIDDIAWTKRIILKDATQNTHLNNNLKFCQTKFKFSLSN